VTPREYIDIARERWRFIAAAVLLGILVAGAVSYLLPPQYKATATVLVAAQSTVDPASASDGEEISAQRLRTYVELMRSKRLATDVINVMGLNTTPEELVERIQVTSAPESVLLNATVTDGSPDQAVQIANVVADQFFRNVSEIEQPPDPARPPLVAAKVFEPATPPAQLSAPRPVLYLVLGLALGLLAGAAAALLRNALDTSLKGRGQLEEALRAPVLGHIGRDPKIASSPLVIYGDPRAPLAEAYRQLRTNVQFMDVDRTHKVILVTSPSRGEGKSLTVCNLGLALAEAGISVLIIDADLRRPSVARWMRIDGTVGLTTVLVNRVPVQRAVQGLAPALDVLPSGLLPPNPSELLGSDRMVDLLQDMRSAYDVILIDSPPLLPVTDAAVLGPRVDGVLVVARHGKTRVQDLQAAKDSLDAVSARILGSVMTMAPYTGEHLYASTAQNSWKQRNDAPLAPHRPFRRPMPATDQVAGHERRDGQQQQQPPQPPPPPSTDSGTQPASQNPQLVERGGGAPSR
jgi:capsular exopolysaccharide synthesis family protein